jgi:hypothetical protein
MKRFNEAQDDDYWKNMPPLENPVGEKDSHGYAVSGVDKKVRDYYKTFMAPDGTITGIDMDEFVQNCVDMFGEGGSEEYFGYDRYNDKNKLIRNTAISFFKFYDRRRAQGLSLFGRDTPPGKTA